MSNGNENHTAAGDRIGLATQLPATRRRLTTALTTVLLRITPLCLAVGLSFVIYGRWLSLRHVPVTPAQDLAKHVALALNFAAAFDDGQWLPRLQIAHHQVPDIPVFQYYGFMTGAVAYPFLKLGFGGLHALALSAMTLRALGLLAIYRIARFCGLNRCSGWMAMGFYAFEPYLISTLYGRVAIAEFHAHSILPFLLLGLLFFFHGRPPIAFAVTSLALCALAFTHNIFFLYGTAFALLLIATAGLRRPVLLQAIGAVACGLSLAAIQWLPAYLSSRDLVINFYAKNPYHAAGLTIKSGLIGIYRLIGTAPENSRYYFTYSCWTLVGILGLCWLPLRSSRPAFLVVAAVFLAASSGLVDFWKILPHFTHALQFPYRLISFVALPTAIGAAAFLQRFLPSYIQAAAFALAIALSLPALFVPPFPNSLPTDDTGIALDYASSDYIAGDINERNPAAKIIGSDFWLREDNIILASPHEPVEISLTASSIFPDKTISFGVIESSSKYKLLTPLRTLPPGIPTKMTFRIANPPASMRIWVSDTVVPAELDHNPAGDHRRLSARLSALVLNGVPLIDLGRATLVTRHGLQRTFHPSLDQASRGPDTPTRIVLPIAYNRFFEISQNGRELKAHGSAQGTTVIQCEPNSDIHVEYRIPRPTIALTLLGSLGLATALFYEGISGCRHKRLLA